MAVASRMSELQIQVGGVSCENVTAYTVDNGGIASAVDCRINGTRLRQVSGKTVAATVNGMSATFASGVLIYGSPSIELIGGGFAGTDTNTTVQIRGRSLGRSAANIKSVKIGAFPCVDVDMQEQTDAQDNRQEFTCVLQGGAGTDHDIVVELVEGGSATASGVFSFQPPSLVSVTPDESSIGAFFADFVIFGSDFSSRVFGLLPTAITVGGSPCGSLELYNSSAIGCLNVSANEFSESGVSVTFGG